MKKLLFVVLALVSMAGAQTGVRYRTQVQDISGRRVAFPVVRFCSEPASGTVCTPLALTGIFSDINLTQPLPNPFTGDQQGNIAFYALAGRYHAQISGNGIVPFDEPDIALQDTTQITGSGLYVLQTSPTINSPTINSPTITSATINSSTINSPTINSPILVTPSIGVAIGTSLNLGGTGVLSTTAQSGTGSLCMTISCVMTTPNIGAATGTSINLSGSAAIGTTLNVTGTSTLAAVNSGSISATAGTPLQALSGSSNNVQINIGRAAVEVNFAVPQSNGFFFTNSDLAAGDFVIRNQTAARRIYIGAGSAAAPVAITNTGMVFYTTSGTVPSQIQNDGGGGIQIGTASTAVPLSVGQNPFSAFSINPGTALVSNPIANQARRGITYAADPLGDVTIWYNSGQTGAGIFFKDGNTLAVMAVPTGGGQLVGRDTTDTLTNKRVTPRVLLTTSSVAAPATLTADINSFDANEWNLTGTGGVLTINLPAGTPTDGQKEILRIKTTNSWTYSFNATFRFSTTTVAPTTTAAGKTDYLGIIWNALDSKWDVVAVDQGH